MPNSNYFNLPITNAGGTLSIDVDELYEYYTIDGAGVTLAASYIINDTGAPREGQTINIRYNGNGLDSVVADPAIYVEIMGIQLTDGQALNKINFISTFTGGTWVTNTLMSFDDTDIIESANITALAVTTAKIAALAVTTAKIDNLAVTAAKIAANTITAAEIAAGTITNVEMTANTVNSTILAVNNSLTTIVVPVSFETGVVGDFKMLMNFAGTLNTVYAYATKAIAATDNATIVCKNNAGTTMATGTITFTASDARGTAYTVTPSTNNTFVAGDILTLTCAKATAGGQANVCLNFTIS